MLMRVGIVRRFILQCRPSGPLSGLWSDSSWAGWGVMRQTLGAFGGVAGKFIVLLSIWVTLEIHSGTFVHCAAVSIAAYIPPATEALCLLLDRISSWSEEVHYGWRERKEKEKEKKKGLPPFGYGRSAGCLQFYTCKVSI